ncbi:MAG: glycine betaine ABC transporter substrate-binding protein, partial [Clostridiaceae bacterium]
VLEDDKHLWPPYHIVPVIRETVLKENSEIEQALNKVNALLTNEAMQELNWKVDGDKKEYADVAKEFLINNKIIEK